MSGHSKWSTIKRQKEINDKAKGQLFSRLSKIISVAVKSGGGPSPDSNHKLRVAIDQARAADMPKENIERVIARASEEKDLEEITYEGFAPGGIAVMVEAATDNKNRTAQEIKSIFERAGGSLGGPGSVAFNFEPRGMVILKKEKDLDSQMLKLIDLGARDILETDGELEAYVNPGDLFKFKNDLEKAEIGVQSIELVQKPKNTQPAASEDEEKRVLKLLETLNEQDDVQNVFVNLA
ncbi:MAG: transcriptional regulator [Candidatus Woesebacteria bacterium GW2011_GWB1_44_11b]|uniref:Probable transcriptional regulatory protein UW21_C0012G0013 n=1 Tax=Candidatus Woesebacteria bacterium GW2011_GWB1_44_11b TaxID=1618580 RepID=A0A0G1GG73_9BACT|nr:MAG: transcriptional regulator [Candidatus Woesebacteria bacterium GW2011_GWB1_44_11b]